MAWAKNGTPDTLTGASATTTISDLTPVKFNSTLVHTIPTTSGAGNNRLRFGYGSVDTGSNYASRESNDGGTEYTRVSQTNIICQTRNHEFFHLIYAINIAGKEKLIIGHSCEGYTLGAGTAPARVQYVAKWTNTSNQYDNVQMYTTSSTLAADTNISALGADITPAAAIPFPSDVQVNSRAEITDTRKMYYRVLGLKYEDDFSTDNWTDNDSTYIGVSGGSMNWNCKRDGSNDASVYDLTSTSANWVLRFKLTVTNVSSSTQAGNGFYVGLSSLTQTAGQSTSQDFIGVSIYNDNTDTYRTIDADGSALPAIYQGDSSQSTTYNTNSVWYYEIIKTGSSYTVEAFSGSDYSTGSEGKITGSSDATGLRYLKVLNDMASIPTSTNPFQGTINDLKFYDGVTSTTDNAWKELGT